MSRSFLVPIFVFALLVPGMPLLANPYVHSFDPEEGLELVVSDSPNSPQNSWPRSLVGFHIRCNGSSVSPQSLGLFDADNHPVTHQWSGLKLKDDGSLLSGVLHAMVDLPRGGERTFQLKRVEGAQPGSTGFFKWREPDGLAIDSRAAFFKVPASIESPDKDTAISGPLAGLTLAHQWISRSKFISSTRKLTGVSTTQPERGPLFNTYRVEYSFEHGGSYTAELRVIAGMPFIELSETAVKLPPSADVMVEMDFEGFQAPVRKGQRIGAFTHYGNAPCTPHLELPGIGQGPSLAIFARNLESWRDGVYSLEPGSDTLCVGVEGTGKNTISTRWRICSAEDGSASQRHTAIAIYHRSEALAQMAAYSAGRHAGTLSDHSAWLYYYRNAISLDRYKDWNLSPGANIRDLSKGTLTGGLPPRKAARALFKAYQISNENTGPRVRSSLSGPMKAATTEWIHLAETAYRMPDHPLADEWMQQAQRALTLGASLYTRPEVRSWQATAGRPAQNPAATGAPPSFQWALERVNSLHAGQPKLPAPAKYEPGIGKHTGYGAVLADGSGRMDVRLLQLDKGPNSGWAKQDARAGGVIALSIGGKPFSAVTPFDGIGCQMQVWERGDFRPLGVGPLAQPFYDLGAFKLASVTNGSTESRRQRSVLLAGDDYLLVEDQFTTARSRWCWESAGELPHIHLFGKPGQTMTLQSEQNALIHERKHPGDRPSRSLALVSDRPDLINGSTSKPGFQFIENNSGVSKLTTPKGTDTLFWPTDGSYLRHNSDDGIFQGERGVIRRSGNEQVTLALFDGRDKNDTSRRLIGTRALQLELEGEAIGATASFTENHDPKNPVQPITGHYSAAKTAILRLHFGNPSEGGGPPRGSLIASWKMDEGKGRQSIDIKAPQRPAQITGGEIKWIEGCGFNASKAIEFNGDAHLETFYTDALPEDFSISTWVRTKAPGTVFSKASVRAGKRDKGSVELIIDENGMPRLQCGSSTLAGPEAINDDKWHHAVWTVSDGTQRLYIDGKEVASSPFDTTLPAAPLRIGAGQDPTGENPLPNLIGAVDDFRIFNFALSTTELEAFHLVGLRLAPIVITSQPAQTLHVGETFNYSLAFTGAPFVQFRFVGLPNWMKFEGRLTGTPTARDVGLSKPITLAGACPWGPGQQRFQVNVLPPLVKSDWKLYVNGRAIPARYIGRGIEARIPAGSGEWQFTNQKPAPQQSRVLSATEGPAGVAVSVRSVAGANSYRIEASEDEGGTWAEVASGKASRILVPKPDADSYLLRVIASDGKRNSPPSAPLAMGSAGSEEAIPPAPGAPTLTASNVGVRLVWSAVNDATTYKVHRRKVGEDSWQTLHQGGAPAYIDREQKKLPAAFPLPGYRSNADKDVTQTVIYEYAVSALNGETESPRGAVASTDPRSWQNWSPIPAPVKTYERRRAALWQPPIKPADQAPPVRYPTGR